MNRTLAALFVVGISFLAAVGTPSSNAADSDEVTTTELDDGLLRSRLWRQTPGQLAAPTLSDFSHDSLTVSWMAPDSTVFEIVDYDLQYRAGSAGGFADWVHDGTATQATITGLAEDTEYQVRVRAVSEVGEGDWSATATARPWSRRRSFAKARARNARWRRTRRPARLWASRSRRR